MFAMPPDSETLRRGLVGIFYKLFLAMFSIESNFLKVMVGATTSVVSSSTRKGWIRMMNLTSLVDERRKSLVKLMKYKNTHLKPLR